MALDKEDLEGMLIQKAANLCYKKGADLDEKLPALVNVIEKTIKLYDEWKNKKVYNGKSLKELNVPFAGHLSRTSIMLKNNINTYKYKEILTDPYFGGRCTFTNLDEILGLIGRKEIINANQGYTFDLDKGIYKELLGKVKKKWKDKSEKEWLAVVDVAFRTIGLYKQWNTQDYVVIVNGKKNKHTLKELNIPFGNLHNHPIVRKNKIDTKDYENTLVSPYTKKRFCNFTNLDEVLDLIGDTGIIKARGRFLIETDFDKKIYEIAKKKWKDKSEKEWLAVTKNVYDIISLYEEWKNERVYGGKSLEELNVPFAGSLKHNNLLNKKIINIRKYINTLSKPYELRYSCNFTNLDEVLDLIKQVNVKKYNQIDKARKFNSIYGANLGDLFEKSVYCALKAVKSDWETYNGNREIKHNNCMPDLSKDSLENISKNGRILIGDIKTTPDYGGKYEDSVKGKIEKYTQSINKFRNQLKANSKYMLTPVKCDSEKKDVLWIYHLNGKPMKNKEVNGVEVKYKDIFSYLGNNLEKAGRKDIVNFWQYIKDNMLYNECPENEKKLGVLKNNINKLWSQYQNGDTSGKLNYEGWLKK